MSQPIIIIGKDGKKTVIIPQQQQQRHQPVYQPQMVPMVQQPTMMHQPMMAQPMGHPHMQQQQMGHPHMQQQQMGHPQMQQQQMQAPPNFGMGMQFNKWAQPNFNYASMPGYNPVNYQGGWNPNIHDSMLKNNINMVFQKHDYNRNGQLDGQEFFPAYQELCLRMGMAPPQSQQEVWQMAMQADTNGDGMISSMEMFMFFKQIQGIRSGMMMQPGMQMAW